VPVRHVQHPHPQAEIARLVCDHRLAEEVLRWRPTTSLEQGVAETKTWMTQRPAT
jgi:nucleoside-diphosphate-sugar epimerase